MAEWLSLGQEQRHNDFWALRRVFLFHLERGECLGIIGPNGARKTTLLKILTRALYPTAGKVNPGGRQESPPGQGSPLRRLILGTTHHPVEHVIGSLQALLASLEEVEDSQASRHSGGNAF